MTGNRFGAGVLLLLLSLTGNKVVLGAFVIQTQDSVSIEIKGYSGLADTSLFEGSLSAEGKQTIDTSYRGLALLVFAQGQQYPFIIGVKSFTLKIESPHTQPSFSGSEENDTFYKLLEGTDPWSTQPDFPHRMIEAKQLLDSSHSIHTVDELAAMKERFQHYVETYYHILERSDMLRRLIAQYFMMHEYVDYHVAGTPATEIQVRYQQLVMDGVRDWLDLLKTYIPQHEILNYIVSLYYDRSMASLASRIMESYKEDAICPGAENLPSVFPPDLTLTDGKGNSKTLHGLSGTKLIAFVSDDCPVSLVDTVIRARSLSRKSDITLIVHQYSLCPKITWPYKEW